VTLAKWFHFSTSQVVNCKNGDTQSAHLIGLLEELNETMDVKVLVKCLAGSKHFTCVSRKHRSVMNIKISQTLHKYLWHAVNEAPKEISFFLWTSASSPKWHSDVLLDCWSSSETAWLRAGGRSYKFSCMTMTYHLCLPSSSRVSNSPNPLDEKVLTSWSTEFLVAGAWPAHCRMLSSVLCQLNS
jgi:hypothetical protein